MARKNLIPEEEAPIQDVDLLAQEIFLRFVPSLIETNESKMAHEIARFANLARITAKIYLEGPKGLASFQKELEEVNALIELEIQ